MKEAEELLGVTGAFKQAKEANRSPKSQPAGNRVPQNRKEAGRLAAAYRITYSGFGFLGRPLPETLRMASRADFGYMASLIAGFILATERRCFTVSALIVRIPAISLIVNPSLDCFYRITHVEELLKRYANGEGTLRAPT
jgi:hypothetical protein